MAKSVANLIISDDILKKAKIMYFHGYSADEIVGKLNIPYNTVSEWIFGKDGRGESPSCWAVVKAKASEASIISYVIDKQGVFDRTTSVAHRCVTMMLEQYSKKVANEEVDFTVDEIRKMASIVVDMDKVARLESGKATSIIDTTTGLSAKELREIIASDPIADVVDVQYVELE